MNVLTDTELAMCRLLGAKYVSRDHDGMFQRMVEFWAAKPWASGELWDGDYTWNAEDEHLASLDVEHFPTELAPGMCVKVMDDGSCEEVKRGDGDGEDAD